MMNSIGEYAHREIYQRFALFRIANVFLMQIITFDLANRIANVPVFFFVVSQERYHEERKLLDNKFVFQWVPSQWGKRTSQKLVINSVNVCTVVLA